MKASSWGLIEYDLSGGLRFALWNQNSLRGDAELVQIVSEIRCVSGTFALEPIEPLISLRLGCAAGENNGTSVRSLDLAQ